MEHRKVVSELLTVHGPNRGLRRFVGPKRTTAILLISGLVAVGWYLRQAGIADANMLQNVVARHSVSAPIVFIMLYAVATLCALPAIPLNLAAGLYWGPVLGGLLSSAAASLGAIAAFAVARLAFGRPLARRFDSKLIAEIQREFAAKGWWFLAFVRLNPIFPTGPLNFIFGLTSISAWKYGLVTFLFLAPQGMFIAFIGRSMGTFVVSGDISSRLKMVLVVSAGATALATLVFAARLFNQFRFGRHSDAPVVE